MCLTYSRGVFNYEILMELLQKLKDVRTTKQNYFVLQHRFYAELSKRFPHLMNSNMADIANTLENELEILLCTALKYKSIKIRLVAGLKYGNENLTYVNVQRSVPGFYYPQSQRKGSDIHYMHLHHVIDDNNDMLSITEDEHGKHKQSLRIALSELKKPNLEKQIVPRNLDAYYKLLKEVMAYRQRFLCYLNEGHGNNIGIRFKVKELEFSLQAKSMIVIITEECLTDNNYNDTVYYSGGSPGSFKYNKDKNDLLNLLAYSEQSSRNFDMYVHERLKFFINNYKEIYINFEREEKRKREAYKTCLNFIKQIQTYTLPFKILNEITNKKV